MRVLPYGREALLIEYGSAAEVARASSALASLPGVREAVPGARTVLLRCSVESLAQVQVALADVDQDPAPAAGRPEVTLDVRYDGADLAALAAEVAMSPEAVVRAHSEATYVVAFCGFAPGFAYLSGLPAELQVPRLASPRTRVPAGSVAVAGEFAGVYPRGSPGGWRLIGHCDAPLWDARRDPPAMLSPGTPVRFRDVSGGG